MFLYKVKASLLITKSRIRAKISLESLLPNALVYTRHVEKNSSLNSSLFVQCLFDVFIIKFSIKHCVIFAYLFLVEVYHVLSWQCKGI